MLRNLSHLIIKALLLVLVAMPIIFSSCKSHKKLSTEEEIYISDFKDASERVKGAFSKNKPAKEENADSNHEAWDKLGLKYDKNDNALLYNEVASWLGVPYLFAGHDKQGTDCSGLVMEVFLKVYGKKVHRNSTRMLEENCDTISLEDIQEADLIFFATGSNREAINHVGIYLKEGKFVHAASKGVKVDDIETPYYRSRMIAVGRVRRYSH